MHAKLVLPPKLAPQYSISNADKTAFSILRIFAAFSVIVIHVADPSLPKFSIFANSDWWSGHIYHSIFRSGIPIFLMLTGALVLPGAQGFTFIKNRLLRIILPFLFWTLIYLVAKHRISEITISHYFYDLIKGNNYSYHFWYLYFIMLVYMIMPLLKSIIDKVQLNANIVFVSLVILTSATYFIPEECNRIASLHNQIVFVGYTIFGYCLLHTRSGKWYGSTSLAILMVVGGLLITFIGTYLQGNDPQVPFGSLYENTKLHVFLKIFGVWILIRKLARNVQQKFTGSFRSLSDLCFGVYLIHPLVLEHIIIVRLGISINTIHPIVGIGITSILCFTIGAVIIYILSKLPFGKYTY